MIAIVHSRVGVLTAMLCALAGFAMASTGGGILFPADASVPLTVRAFAWRVIETRCNFQRHELGQRSFWAHDVRTSRVDGTVAYSIRVLSDLDWKKTEPPATVEMVVVDDGGRLRLASLNATFAVCASAPD